jgi:hypothetical protein
MSVSFVTSNHAKGDNILKRAVISDTKANQHST